MHISEGVLSMPVLLAGWAGTAAGAWIGLARLDWDRIMAVAILSACFFVASLVHVPIGPASAHLVLAGLAGAVLGWAAFPAILVGLTLQALLFQYGGLTALGVNTLTMALPAVLLRLLLNRPIRTPGRAQFAAAFAVGFGSVLASALLTAMALALTDEGFLRAAQVLVLGHLPVMAIEGVITAFAVTFIQKARPEVLGPPRPAENRS